MWVNPKYADQYRPPTPPAETGRRLATLPRGDEAELWVSLAEYQGRPYISLRVWARDADGQFWPIRGKGCSVRISEAGEVIAALRSAMELLDQADPADAPPPARARDSDDEPRYVEPRRRRPRQAFDPAEAPDLGPTRPGFSEM